jgi:hypothetical protein
MGHGLGPAQRAMLEELDPEHGLTVPDLAGRLKLSERRARAVARSREARGLVVIAMRQTGWRGEGEYGRLVQRSPYNQGDLPTAMVVKAGERFPRRRAWKCDVDMETREAKHDIEFVRNGVPTAGLYVWLPREPAATGGQGDQAVGPDRGQGPGAARSRDRALTFSRLFMRQGRRVRAAAAAARSAAPR